MYIGNKTFRHLRRCSLTKQRMKLVQTSEFCITKRKRLQANLARSWRSIPKPFDWYELTSPIPYIVKPIVSIKDLAVPKCNNVISRCIWQVERSLCLTHPIYYRQSTTSIFFNYLKACRLVYLISAAERSGRSARPLVRCTNFVL